MKYKKGDVIVVHITAIELFNRAGMSLKRIETIVRVDTAYVVVGNDRYLNFGYIVRLATPEDVEQERIRIEERDAKIIEISKEYVREAKQLKEIAESVFGEERVDVEEDSVVLGEEKHKLVIHFPEIVITNSRQESHIIKDLYVRFVVDNHFVNIVESESACGKCTLLFSGMRTTRSLREWESHYSHSHIPGNRDRSFYSFCLGRSEFGLSIQNVQLEPTEINWMGLLLALEAYVSWESLEGGPHRLISGITYLGSDGLNSSTINRELERLVGGIPEECWEFTDCLNLINFHPELYRYFNENSSIRNTHGFTKDALKEKFLYYQREMEGEFPPYIWKGVEIPFKLFMESEDSRSIPQSLVDLYANSIVEKAKKFNYIYGYNRQKHFAAKKVFGETRALK